MTIHYADDLVTLHLGDALTVLGELADDSVDCIVTSPPYFGLRDYGVEGQYGLESTPTAYVETMRGLFAECRRVLADEGTLWLNIGDSYSAKRTYQVDGTIGRKGAAAMSRPYDTLDDRPAKNMLGIPWRVAFALQDDGWTLRNAIVWHKPNAMPESVTDRLSCDYEHIFLFSKSRAYWFDLDPIREPCVTPDRHVSALSWDRETKEADVPGQSMRQHRRGRDVYGGADGKKRERNRGGRTDGLTVPAEPGGIGSHENGRNPGSVWNIPTQSFPAAHFAVMPVALAQRCIAAGCKPGGVVLDPFSGSGTTGLAATRLGRRYVGIDLNRQYLDLSLRTRLAQGGLAFDEESA